MHLIHRAIFISCISARQKVENRITSVKSISQDISSFTPSSRARLLTHSAGIPSEIIVIRWPEHFPNGASDKILSAKQARYAELSRFAAVNAQYLARLSLSSQPTSRSFTHVTF